MEFRWIAWNIEHIGEHGVKPADAEYVVRNAKPPYPRLSAPDEWYVAGQSRDGRYMQVVYVYDEVGTGAADSVFVIHARPLNDAEKRRLRRRRR